jgi:nitrogen regulatory protein PII
MKHVKVVIRPEKLNEVRECLKNAGCCKGLMITDIVGQGNQKGITQIWRGEKYTLDLVPKVMLEMVVRDQDVPTIRQAILECAWTGEPGDGKIFIYPVEEVVRIRTGEAGEIAL